MRNKNKEQVFITQEPAKKVILRKFSDNLPIWKNLFISNVCQLLGIWIMLLLQFATEYKFNVEEYIGNLLVFAMVTCATNLSDAFGKDNSKVKKKLPSFTVFVMILVICFASILYCLLLICDREINIHIKINVISSFSIIFTLIVILIGILQATRR